MPKMPVIKSKDLVKALLKMGFFESRQKGSHLILKHQDGRRTVIPMHSGSNIPRGTLKAILKDIKVSIEDILKSIYDSNRN